MYADKDDARPLKTLSSHELGRWLVAIGLGVAVSVAALFVASLSSGLKKSAVFPTALPAASGAIA